MPSQRLTSERRSAALWASEPQPKLTTLAPRSRYATAFDSRCAALRLSDARIELSAIEARQGELGHRVLYVLAVSMVLAVFAMTVLALTLP